MLSEKINNVLLQYRSVFSYLFFGICTTIVNILVYYICADILYLTTIVSTLTAWFFSVLFACITNKIWVFSSNSWNMTTLSREVISFYLCRITTGVLDLAIMTVTVDVLRWNGLIMKIISNVIIIILNYLASKSVIFKRRE